jgi:Ca2+-binding RTX toxin-like protein
VSTRRLILLALVALVALAASAAFAAAKTSHDGWPKIDGKTVMNSSDKSGTMRGTRSRHNKLLGGHGNDTIQAGAIGDVLWGDYKPSGQPTSQHDTILGGAGKDFIYASHGTNDIVTGGGPDQVHAHFGHGTIKCNSDKATIFLSHKSRKLYKLTGCTRISYKTTGS